ncbi:GNAT family N-acetyltransferase [Flavisolibacter nicotianae]|uniref:GNAT family N-acetyltransferase n=1 Tax=Flavisolibacter nicotianae TaxID=2364882 RepID=UPI000EAEADB2|nr:GNAT family N-acetyltransferase [Flavisolibacter nicotianae]
MQPIIRKMRIEDAFAVSHLSHQLGYALSEEQTQTQLEAVLTNKEHTAFVATMNGAVSGWIHAFKPLYIESLPFVEIGGLVVDEAHRGNGIGKNLVEAVMHWCHEQNIPTLRLRSQVKRKEAHLFYKALGFEEIKQQIVFQRKLSQ